MDASGDGLVGNLKRRNSEEENDDVSKAKQPKCDTTAEILKDLQSSSGSSINFLLEEDRPFIPADETDDDILKYKKLISQLETLLSEMLKESNEDDRECVKKWIESLLDLNKETYDSNVVIGVVGKTRHGKSSLINALLEPYCVLPVSGTQSCTAVVVQIEKNQKTELFEAEIQFIDKMDWDRELSSLKDDYENGKEDRFKPEKVAGMAYAKLEGVYGRFEQLEDLPNEVAILSSLGKTITETSKSSFDLKEKIEKYIRAFSKAGNQYWPIVKKVTVRIPGNDTILDGCTLVDLPGYGDDIAARVKVAEDFLKNCAKILVVSEITESLSNKYVRLDGSFGEQILKDLMETNIVFICTMNDKKVDLDEIKSELKNGKEEDAANQLHEKIKEIESSLSSLGTTGKDIRIKLLSDRRRYCIDARASFVKKKIKTFYQEFVQKWKRRDTRVTKSSNPENEPAVFCVSPKDYLNIKHNDLCETFSEENETEIPQLKIHINDLVVNKRRTNKQRKIKKLDDVVTDIAFYLQDGNFQNKSGDIKDCVYQSYSRLMDDIADVAGTIHQDIIKEMSDIILNLADGREQAEQEAIGTCGKWPIQYHRKTYFAAVRRDGIYFSKTSGNINFNADLIRPFTSSMKGVWSDFFGKRLWCLIDERNKTVINIIKKTADNLCEDLEKKNISREQLCDVKKHLFNSTDSKLKDMETSLKDMVLKEQKKISRICEPIVKKIMRNIYKRVPKKETDSSVKHMEIVMKTDLEKIKCEMFQQVHDEVIKNLKNLLLEEVKTKICEVWKTSLVYSFNYSFGQLSFSGQHLLEKKFFNELSAIKKETSELCTTLHINESISSRWDLNSQIVTEDKEIIEDSHGSPISCKEQK